VVSQSALTDEFGLDGTFFRFLIIGINNKNRKIGLANAPNFSRKIFSLYLVKLIL